MESHEILPVLAVFHKVTGFCLGLHSVLPSFDRVTFTKNVPEGVATQLVVVGRMEEALEEARQRVTLPALLDQLGQQQQDLFQQCQHRVQLLSLHPLTCERKVRS